MRLVRVVLIALAWSVRATTALSRSSSRSSSSRSSNHAGGAIGDESKARHACDGCKGAGLGMKLPPTMEGAMRTRGGAVLRRRGTKEPLFHRAGIGDSVNRQAVPPTEALSRYEVTYLLCKYKVPGIHETRRGVCFRSNILSACHASPPSLHPRGGRIPLGFCSPKRVSACLLSASDIRTGLFCRMRYPYHMTQIRLI